MLRTVDVERHHVGAEGLRKHDCGVVRTRLRTVDRIIFGRDDPVQIVVGAQRGQDLLADVDPDWNQSSEPEMLWFLIEDIFAAGDATPAPSPDGSM
ncbi:hypothetical protein [Microbacterium petrolearium]